MVIWHIRVNFLHYSDTPNNKQARESTVNMPKPRQYSLDQHSPALISDPGKAGGETKARSWRTRGKEIKKKVCTRIPQATQRNRVFFFMSVVLRTEGKGSLRVKVKKSWPYASLVTTPRRWQTRDGIHNAIVTSDSTQKRLLCFTCWLFYLRYQFNKGSRQGVVRIPYGWTSEVQRFISRQGKDLSIL
jgi:hypothetical protein